MWGQPPSQAGPTARTTREEARGRGIRVLIADDDPHCRKGLQALLSTWPAVEVVCEAADGREALRLSGQLQPDVVLMDLCMPRLDGVEATRLLKRRWPGIRVVMLTMYAAYQAEGLAAGADSFLVKGCSSQELWAAISRVPFGPGEQDDLRQAGLLLGTEA